MLQVGNTSDSSSSSSDSDSDNDKECKTINQHQKNETNSNNMPSSNENNRKRKLSNINSSNNDLKSSPPKKRQRTNNIIINTHIENDDNTNNNKNRNRIKDNNNNNKQHKKQKLDKNKKKKKKKRKKSETPPKKPVESIKIEELECIVCRELPASKIYQCINSHLMCLLCYNRICENKECLCPECRIRMSRREPIRNKLAENYLSSHLFDCLNKEKGCNNKIQFKYLNEHSNNECKYRLIKCKYNILGCQWKGLSKDRHVHNKICLIKKMKTKKILKLVENINNKNNELEKIKYDKINKYMQISKLFQMRCHNIISRDIRINNWNENSKKTEIVNSNFFNAMHKRWKFQLKIQKVLNSQKMDNNCNNSNNNNCNNNNCNINQKLNKLYIRIQCVSQIRRRIPYEICVLRGPDFGNIHFEPVRFECEITKNNKDSKWIEFIPNNILFTDEQIKNKFFTNYNTENKMNLRVIMIDKRMNGNISNEFGGANDDFDNDIDRISDFDDIDNNNNNNSDDMSSESTSITSTHSAQFSDNSDDSDDDLYTDLDDYDESSDDYY